MRPVAVWRCRYSIFQLTIEAAAVWQAGKRVLHRQFMRAPFGGYAPCNFAALQLEKAPG
jgi:hypothetical protein